MSTIYGNTYRWTVSLPPLIWVGVLLFLPYLLLFAHSFWRVKNQQIDATWNFSNYLQLFQNPMYAQVLSNSFKVAGSVTLLATVFGYPLAYFISFHTDRCKGVLYQIVIIPLWVSYLVRGYAWKTILGSDGVLNGLLKWMHLIDAPLSYLLYSPFAVILMLTHIYTSFLFLPTYAAMEHIPRRLLEASSDLGASPFKTFWKVILPLSLPGVFAGAVFSFVLTLGDFLAPLLVGGPSGIMISNVVVSLFGAAFNWPLGAAIAVVMMVIVMGLLKISEKMEARGKALA